MDLEDWRPWGLAALVLFATWSALDNEYGDAWPWWALGIVAALAVVCAAGAFICAFRPRR